MSPSQRPEFVIVSGMPLTLGLKGGAFGFSVRDKDGILNSCEELGALKLVGSSDTVIDEAAESAPSGPEIYQKMAG